jgi:hypothetical protein
LTQQDVTQGDCASIVSTEDQSISEYNILNSPNPFEDFIQITSLDQSLDQVNFKVVSILGDVLITGELNQEEIVLNLFKLGGEFIL